MRFKWANGVAARGRFAGQNLLPVKQSVPAPRIAYGEGNGFIGDLKHFMHLDVLAEPVGTIPAILFSEFQLIFCATVCAIAIGGVCERGRLLPLIPFIFVSIF